MAKILFAHPDQKFSQICVQHLKSHFQVDSVHDGLAALRRLKLSPPSLVISEYHLPLLSGISLLQFVRSNPRFAATPFVFFSDHYDNSEALNLGASDWIDIRTNHPDLLLDRIYYHLKQNRHVQVS